MELRFLGGAREVGRMSLLVDIGQSRVLVDHGIQPTDPPSYPRPPPPVDMLAVTHGHLDHCALAPLLTQDGVPLAATGCTLDIMPILCRDMVKVHRKRGYSSPYHDSAVNSLPTTSQQLKWRKAQRFGDIEVEAHRAGHIPGAAMLKFNDQLLFTGDVNTTTTRLCKGAEPTQADVLVMEATYSGREQPDRLAEENRFIEHVDRVMDRDGVVLVPSFATGRTQELVLLLHDAGYAPIVDGMGLRMTDAMIGHHDAIRDTGRLRQAFRRAELIKHHGQRKRAVKPGSIIVTTSGMLEGGPVLSYLPKVAGDPKNAVLLPGYQAEGTNGERLLKTGTVEGDRGTIRVHAEVERFHLSGHAGHSQLLWLAEQVQPETILLCHTDDGSELAGDLATITADVRIPQNQELVMV